MFARTTAARSTGAWRAAARRAYSTQTSTSTSTSVRRTGAAVVAGVAGLGLLSQAVLNEPKAKVEIPARGKPGRLISMDEVERHSALPDKGGQGLWVVIDGKVYE